MYSRVNALTDARLAPVAIFVGPASAQPGNARSDNLGGVACLLYAAQAKTNASYIQQLVQTFLSLQSLTFLIPVVATAKT